jgi:hypothetical protein
METEMVPETSVLFNQLTRFLPPEDFISDLLNSETEQNNFRDFIQD